MKTPKNIGESVRQRLLDGARARGEEYNLVLTRYLIERLLYRLSRSPQRDHFVLKGAALYVVWAQEAESLSYRPTRDLDLWASGAPDTASIVAAVREIVGVEVEDDGLHFATATIRGQSMREDEQYEGCRLTLEATLNGARIPLTIDFGFGDAITPPAPEIDYPVLLPNLSAPRLRAYPRETVVAEKLQALVALDMTNTRMKDFFDLWTLARAFGFDGPLLLEAVQNTFARRQTPFPTGTPTAFTNRFTLDAGKVMIWTSFGKRSRLKDLPPLHEVVRAAQVFIGPVLEAAHNQQEFDARWTPQDGWKM